MSIEQSPERNGPTSKQESASTISEQLRARRQKEVIVKEYYERVKDELRDIFKRYQTGPERIQEISNKLEPFLA